MHQPSLNLDHTLGEIRRLAIAMTMPAWVELGALMDEILPNPLNPFFLLPLATGKACAGSTAKLIQISAIIVLIDISLRILDDCADRDNPNSLDRSIGFGRAINYAMALNTLATRELLNITHANQGLDDLITSYFHAFLQVCKGQDRDMKSQVNSLPEYQELVKLKTLPAYEFATVMGARMASTDEHALALSAKCGQHLGWMTQILDDIESLWFPVVTHSREVEKKTFPVLLGLTLNHPNAKIIEELFQTKEYDRVRICHLLDDMDVRPRLIHLALDHRDEAIKSLATLPNPEGKTILNIWLNWYLGDGERLLKCDR